MLFKEKSNKLHSQRSCSRERFARDRGVRMKKRWATVLSLVIILVIVVSAFASIEIYDYSAAPVASKKLFYVGVTYCGNLTTEAEQLIDRVKNYTNLFVLDSGSLIQNLNATEQICDYAVNSGLSIIVYYGTNGDETVCDSLLSTAQARWGSHFLGLYYNDEPGGKMLDGQVYLYDNKTGVTITKGLGGSQSELTNSPNNSTQVTFSPSGLITIDNIKNVDIPSEVTVAGTNSTLTVPYTIEFTAITYYSNGTITRISSIGQVVNGPIVYQPNDSVQTENGAVVTGEGNISQFESYQELWDSRPLQTCAEVANAFVNTEQNTLGSIGNQSAVKLFTSDYVLNWFDYQGGYDVVLAQLGWNQSTTEDIALVRGAADMQNKSWGAMITWQSLSTPYLQSGTQMYSEMRQAYESGAEYVVVFNYSPNDNGTGLLQDEHFAALQKFWTNVVQNPQKTNNVTGQDALVLPSDYGGRMGSPTDNVWSLWQHDNRSEQVWTALQASLSKYGSKLDIVYDDPAYLTAGRYQHVNYWNQTI